MKKALILLAAVLFTASWGGCKTPLDGGLLWKISGNGLAEPSYLFGTHHLVKFPFLDNVSGFYSALDRVRQVVVEVDMSDSIKEALSRDMKIKSLLLLPPDTTYATLLDSADLALLDETLLGAFGVTSLKFYARPKLLGVTLIQMRTGQVADSLNTFLDSYIRKVALDWNYSVVGLETVEEQFRVLGTSSLKEDAQKLMWELRNKDSVDRMSIGFEKTYRSQDLAQFENDFEETLAAGAPSLQSIENEREILLDRRNNNWMTKLPALIRAQPTLIAVGAGHLISETGLILQLRKLGYTVESVR